MAGRVLIINDEVDLLEACSIVLEAEDCAVETLLQGSRAVERVSEFHPDLVLLDWVMADMSGDVVLRRLRSAYGSALRIVVMSALHGLRPRAVELGADDFLQKPFDSDRLASVVAANIRSGPHSDAHCK